MKKNIPTHDPQTGDLNPYYEELTGFVNPLSPNFKSDSIIDNNILRLIRQKYVGREFAYKSKYGGYLKGIVCEDIDFNVDNIVVDGEVFTKVSFNLISNIGNAYEMENVFLPFDLNHS